MGAAVRKSLSALALFFTNSCRRLRPEDPKEDENEREEEGEPSDAALQPRCVRLQAQSPDLSSSSKAQTSDRQLDDLFRRHSRPDRVQEVQVTGQLALSLIPVSLGLFTGLTKLDLSHNALTDLPWSLVYLKQLRHLDLSANRLTVLSVVVGYLPRLEHLDVSNNYLETLPTVLVQLRQLATLEIGGNDFGKKSQLIRQTDVSGVLSLLKARSGRGDLWRSFDPECRDPDTILGDSSIKTLFEICVDVILTARVDYLGCRGVPPVMKTHLRDVTSNGPSRMVQLAKCSRCEGFFSNKESFNSHDCTS